MRIRRKGSDGGHNGMKNIIYLSGIVNYAHCSNKLSQAFEGHGIWGFGGGLVYSTTVGPFSLYAHWNDMHHRFGAYFSFGYEF